MIIQSRRIWIAGQFIPAQLEVKDGVIARIYQYGEKPADEDYGDCLLYKYQIP